MNKDIAKHAAHWWANFLREPARLDNGDNSETGVMTLMMATILQASERKGITSEKVDVFEKKLAKKIEGMRAEKYHYIGVDYNPDMILSECAAATGIDCGMTVFPWKTNMTLHEEEVMVSCGYGNPYIKLSEAEERETK